MGDLLQTSSFHILCQKPGGLSEGSLFIRYVSECSKSLPLGLWCGKGVHFRDSKRNGKKNEGIIQPKRESS